MALFSFHTLPLNKRMLMFPLMQQLLAAAAAAAVSSLKSVVVIVLPAITRTKTRTIARRRPYQAADGVDFAPEDSSLSCRVALRARRGVTP